MSHTTTDGRLEQCIVTIPAISSVTADGRQASATMNIKLRLLPNDTNTGFAIDQWIE